MDSPYAQRNFRVEVPAWPSSEGVCFPTKDDALYFARLWSIEDSILVLVWSFAAAMYVGRFDGRKVSS